MAKDVYPLLAWLVGIGLGLFFISSLSGLAFLMWMGWLSLIFTLPVMYFFRSPKPKVPRRTDVIVSSAEGKVVSIRKVYEENFFKDTVMCVSVYMNFLNVHVNRVPIYGVVSGIDYRQGKNMVAFNEKSSKDNEHSLIYIKGEKINVLVKQIAGLVARRIVIDVENDQTIYPGMRLGMIRLGSRVDLFFPTDVILRVSEGDKVSAGETIIGEMP